jgi:hypothetical protein
MTRTVARNLPLCSAFVLALLMWAYCTHGILLVRQRLDAGGFPERNFSDLYPRWLGARELLLHGRDPYSQDVTREIQQGYYGRPIDSSRPSDPVDEQRFAYPLFVVFLLAPTVKLPFAVVKMLFTILLSASAVGTVLLWIRFLELKMTRAGVLVCILMTLATLPYAEGIQFQQLSLLVAFFLAAAIFAMARQKFVLAGLLLAVATIKPQLSIWIIAFVFLWSFCQWRMRKWVAIACSSGVFALLLASERLLARWPYQFIAGIQPYLRYTHATTSLQELVGRVGGIVALCFLGGLSAFAAWRATSKPDSEEFKLAIALVLAFTCIAIPSLAPHNQALLVPAYLLLWKERALIRTFGRLARALYVAAWVALIWPWIAGSLMTLALAFGRASSSLWNLPFATNPLIPIAAFAALAPLLLRQSASASAEVTE